MAVSNRDRVGQAFEVLAKGLGPYVDRRMRARSPHGTAWLHRFVEQAKGLSGNASLEDPAVQLRVIADCWDLAFRDELSRSDRNLVFELRDVRNRWAHNASFTTDDCYRALDSIERLLTAADAPEASDVGRSKDELMRQRYQGESRKATPVQESLITTPTAGLKPWREVVVPHEDVTRGRFNLAEFAADLHQVAEGEGAAEYVDPVEFFRRTYLTEGLRNLLTDALKRLAGTGGVPVVNLQTNFGGGKTHSQIALYHLFGDRPLPELPAEVRQLAETAGLTSLPGVRRAVLVGTKLSPGQPSVKADGTEVRTFWGELAWQLGGREAFDMIAESDIAATNPGAHLNRLLERYSPCLLLVDEWVAYARQLLGGGQTVGGDFETHFTFAQTLTEAARAIPGVLLVVSLPASEAIEGTPSGVGSDIEVGGAAGRAALQRLQNAVARMETPWRPATADESFEIVRRRLFRPIEPDQIAARDATARAFGDLYRKESNEFPAECREPAYVEKVKRAFPIHPELFARLYEDWSTLERFQRTRGVLRLMAGVIHALWEGNDQAPLIMPASIPLADASVASELTRNLEDSWRPILDTDIDGPASIPVALDRELSGTLGRFQAARRVARTVFLGSAPTLGSAHQGIDTARIRLGCVMPGETIATFGDALNRLSSRASYLYIDQGRYWFSTRASAAKTARDRAEQLLAGDRTEIHAHIVSRLRAEAAQRGDFPGGVHAAPTASADVPDEPRLRLVVLGPDRPHIARSRESAALAVASEILERRGNTPREHRNTLAFLASDHRRVDELEHGAADHLAWKSVHDDAGPDGLNLDPNQTRQAADRAAETDRMVALRLAEAYQWVLLPTQPDPTGPIAWDAIKVEGDAPFAVRVSRKLVNSGELNLVYAPTLLRRQLLDSLLSSLWQDGHVSAAALWDTFTRYTYMPRLRDQQVLLDCVSAGPAGVDWQNEGFAVADGFDGADYVGLVVGAHAAATPTALVVRPDVAVRQLERTRAGSEEPGGAGGAMGAGAGVGAGLGPGGEGRSAAGLRVVGAPRPDGPSAPGQPRRFHGAVRVDPERLNRDFGRVVQEVVTHLTGHLGTDVEVTVEISATNSQGFPDGIVRTVTENTRVLRFDDQSGFEPE